MFHAVRFDVAGQPCVPEAVDREEWLLELPSVLGLALNRALPHSDSGSEDGDTLLDTTDDDELCEVRQSAPDQEVLPQALVSAPFCSLPALFRTLLRRPPWSGICR